MPAIAGIFVFGLGKTKSTDTKNASFNWRLFLIYKQIILQVCAHLGFLCNHRHCIYRIGISCGLLASHCT